MNSSLSINILVVNESERAIDHIKHLEKLLDKLKDEHRKKVSVVITYNPPDHNVDEDLIEFISSTPWLELYRQKKHLRYDDNVLASYYNIKTNYVWFLSADDYIFNTGCIEYVLELIDKHQPSGINSQVLSKSATETMQDHASTISIAKDSKKFLDLVTLGGKVSSNIISRIPDDKLSGATPFIGKGYMHLTLQALSYVSSQKSFLNINKPLAYSQQVKNSKNSYHPKFALSTKDSISVPSLVKDCPGYFTQDKKFIQMYWLLNQCLKYNLLKGWRKELISDFIKGSFFNSVRPPLSIKAIILMPFALLLLIKYPSLWLNAFTSIFFKPNLLELDEKF